MSQNYFYPPVSGSSPNASIGTNGAPAPTSSTEIAGKNAAGNLTPYLAGPNGEFVVQPPLAINVAGSVAALGTLLQQDASQLQSLSIHLTSMGTGNIVSFQVSNDNVNWYPCAMMPGGDLTSIITSTTASVGSFTTQLNSRYFRAQVTTYGSGTIVGNAYFKSFGNSPNSVGGYVSAQITDGTNIASITGAGEQKVSVTQPLPAGTNAIGSVTANIGTTNGLALDTSVNSLLKPASTLAAVTTLGSITSTVTIKADTAVNQTNALKVDGSAVTQPISGSVVVTQATGTNLHAVIDSGTITANAGTGTFAVSAASLPLPTGAATSALQSTISGQLPATIGQKTSVASLSTVIASDQSTLPVKAQGRAVGNAPARNDYTITSVTTGAYVQLVASTSTATTKLSVFDSSGQTLAFAVGAAAAEVVQFYIFPGGNGDVELAIPAGSRISVKAISATAAVGEIDINFFN